jgi:hypothetical protein
VLFSSIPRGTRRAIYLLTGVLGLVSAFATAFAAPDQPAPDSVGVIEGDAVSVSGPLSVDFTGGQTRTVLRSGSEVRVRAGTARIDLTEGGQISICGPAHFSVLKSGGTLTVALDSGTIRVHIEREPSLIIYTAQIQAKPIAVGDAPQDLLVGFETPGKMCIRANRGAIRLEQQFTGQSVVIPQSGDILLSDGQLENLREGAGHCVCELQIAKAEPVPMAQPETSQSSASAEVRKDATNAEVDPPSAPGDKPAAKEEPIYEVYMPPLVYDAKAKVQPEFDPNLIVLVRRVRVRPTLIFQGRVEDDTVAAATPLASASGVAKAVTSSAAGASPAKPAAPANDSLVDRVRNYVRRLWSRGD